MDIFNLDKLGVSSKEVQRYIDRTKNNEVSAAITGEFSAGKSTFINALLNKPQFLSSKNTECTPIFIEIKKGNEENIIITKKDHTHEIQEFHDKNIKTLTTYTSDYNDDILSITLPIKTEYINQTISIIDTPGTNTIIKEHEIITKYILKKVDIVLYLVDKVISYTDVEKIKEIKEYTNHIIIIATHMDEKINGTWLNIPKNEIDKLTNTIESQLEKEQITDIEILPIGSLSAYNDNSLIIQIRELINEYVDSNSQNVIKNRVKKQLNLLFEKIISDKKLEISTYETLKGIDISQIEHKVKNIENEIEKIQLKGNRAISKIESDD
ncbi:MAG: dynamin family protein, partial [Peptostreptococcaceae bacterium]